MIWLINLILAEIAAYITYLEYSSSPLQYLVSPYIAMLLFILPLIGAIFKKPFSYPLYLSLFAFHLPLFSHSEFFEGFLDTLYALGLKEAAVEVYNIFSGYAGSPQTLFVVTWLYITAEVLQGNWESIDAARKNGVECELCYLSLLPAFTVSAALLVIFLYLSSVRFPHGFDKLFAAILGVFTFIAGSYLLMKSVEEKS